MGNAGRIGAAKVRDTAAVAAGGEGRGGGAGGTAKVAIGSRSASGDRAALPSLTRPVCARTAGTAPEAHLRADQDSGKELGKKRNALLHRTRSL